MPSRDFIDARDLSFWLYELGGVADLACHPRFADYDRASFAAMLDGFVDVVDREFEGLPALLDEQEPAFDGERVITPPRLKQALDAFVASGWPSAPFDAEIGGMNMPSAVNLALQTPLTAVGGSATGYLFLTAAAARLLDKVGSPQQKRRYLPPLVAHRWYGTMMLSEPQAGSSVGDIRTRAIPQPDGSFHLRGSKMWISAGDHELAENIVHMVLAKIEQPDGSLIPGTRGISLFLVPKYRVNPDGSLGPRNGIRLAGINHKMGNRGTVNTVPVLGDGEPCVGEMLGEPHRGMAAMFHMMNDARIGVGVSAAQYGYAGYRYSLGYAAQRPQGRPAGSRDPSTPQVPIIEHADVRRMLLQQKALSEGAMMLCLHAAELMDRERICEDDAERQRIAALLALLTPMVKTWPSVWGLHANYLAIQVLGGYGYTREYPVERFYRDNRLNEIHEGTTGIQGLDLLGRKVLGDGGRTLALLLGMIREEIACASDDQREDAAALGEAVSQVEAATRRLAQTATGDLPLAMANSTLYLDMLGTLVVGWHWLRTARAARRALAGAPDADTAFLRGKLRACRYFHRYELPRVSSQATLLMRLDDTGLRAPQEEL